MKSGPKSKTIHTLDYASVCPARKSKIDLWAIRLLMVATIINIAITSGLAVIVLEWQKQCDYIFGWLRYISGIVFLSGLFLSGRISCRSQWMFLAIGLSFLLYLFQDYATPVY